MKENVSITSINQAIFSHRNAYVKANLDKLENINAFDSLSGDTPLTVAVESENLEMIDYLVASGADIDAPMFNGCTALHVAIDNAKLEQDEVFSQFENELSQAEIEAIVMNLETTQMILKLLSYHPDIDRKNHNLDKSPFEMLYPRTKKDGESFLYDAFISARAWRQQR